MNILRHITGAVLYASSLVGAAGLVLAGAGALAPPATAAGAGDSSVTVDLSVLDDSGYGAAPVVRSPAPVYGAALPAYQPLAPGGRRLLMPGPRNPVSRLHVPPLRPSKSAKRARKTRAHAKARRHVRAARPARAAPPPKIAPAPAKPRKVAAAPPPAKAKKPATQPPPAKAPKKPPVKVSAIPAPLTAPPPPAPPAPSAEKPEAALVGKAAPSPSMAPPPPPPPMEKPRPAEKAPVAAAAQPEAKPATEEKAALPPAGAALAPGRAMQVVFQEAASKLPGTAKAGLKALAVKLKKQPGLRLQLMAYAGGKSLSSSKARRLSLSRALSVRSFLMENGVRSTRIDVRALGNKTTEEPLNRVDVNVAGR